MNKGYSLLEALLGIILSFFVLHLCVSNFKLVKISNDNNPNQDLISSFQLHQIFNLATEIEVFDEEITFKYLNEEKTLYFVNNKIILKPGTVIYFLNSDTCYFYIKETKIYVKIHRGQKQYVYLIGIL